jgi:hypothetical protein
MLTVTEIQKKTKVIHNRKGQSVEVILPYKVYQELLELKTSLEIYEQPELQESLQRAQQDLKAGRVKTAKSADEAMTWLKQ